MITMRLLLLAAFGLTACVAEPAPTTDPSTTASETDTTSQALDDDDAPALCAKQFCSTDSQCICPTSRGACIRNVCQF